MTLAAWRGQETPASELIETTVREATASGQGRLVSFSDYASSVLYKASGTTTPPATPPGEHSSATSWVTGPWSCLNWPRRRPGQVMWRSRRPRWSGCPSAPG